MKIVREDITRSVLCVAMLILPLAVIGGQGCFLFKTPTGQIDQVKVSQAKAIAKTAIADAITLTTSKGKGADVKPYLKAVGVVVCSFKTGSNLTPDALRMALSDAKIKELRTAQAALIENTLIGVYELLYADRLRSDVSENVFLNSVIEVLCDGITAGAQ